MSNEAGGKDRPWLFFIGVVLILIGIYGTLKTTVNFAAFDKYPTGGVMAFSFLSSSATEQYHPREEDCQTNYYVYPTIYYQADNVTSREPSAAEKQQMEVQEQQMPIQLANCISGVGEARDAAKMNDISDSLLFLLLGVGVLGALRLFRHRSLSINL